MNYDTVIPGVLLLKKTFGMKKRRHLYQCVTNLEHLTNRIIVVPYHVELGFSKKLTNKYVTITLDDATTNTSETLIHATLRHVFGPVDDPVAWNEYQLYYRGLHSKIRVKPEMPTTTDFTNVPDILDRCNEYSFTIDNENTCEFDDAFSLSFVGDDYVRLSIYIADVASQFSSTEIAEMIAGAQNGAPASIYLSHRRVPLLPPAWARRFSLECDALRQVVALDVLIKTSSSNKIVSVEWNPRVLICVKKHYRYDDSPDFPLSEFIRLSSSSHNNITSSTPPNSITKLKSSVAYWMEFYCAEAGNRLWQTGEGIFMRLRGRKMPVQQLVVKNSVREVSEAKYYMNNNYNDSPTTAEEEPRYAQVTSPIRRWIDIYNQQFLIKGGGKQEPSPPIDVINEKMRQIRKLQMDSALMNRFPEISAFGKIGKTFTAILIDVFEQAHKNGKKYKYTVFLEDLNMVSRLTTTQPLDESVPSHTVRIFIFNDEHFLKKKIKLVLCNCDETNRN